jgi:multicomponent Na+:H+ antiporter subunit B
MYDSIILRTVARLLLPLLLLLSVFMLIRGHNLPGGGFIGGLIAACGIILQMIAYGPSYARRVLPYNYLLVAAFGVVFACVSGFPGWLIGAPYMQGLWLPEAIPGIGKVGTPTFFDIGVYIVVVGITSQIAFLLAEEPLLYPLDERFESEEQEIAGEAPAA